DGDPEPRVLARHRVPHDRQPRVHRDLDVVADVETRFPHPALCDLEGILDGSARPLTARLSPPLRRAGAFFAHDFPPVRHRSLSMRPLHKPRSESCTLHFPAVNLLPNRGPERRRQRPPNRGPASTTPRPYTR